MATNEEAGCRVPGCDRAVSCRGLCTKHYQAALKGDACKAHLLPSKRNAPQVKGRAGPPTRSRPIGATPPRDKAKDVTVRAPRSTIERVRDAALNDVRRAADSYSSKAGGGDVYAVIDAVHGLDAIDEALAEPGA